MIRLLTFICLFFSCCSALAQSAFDCDCQRIYYDPANMVIRESKINPSNNALQFPILDPMTFSTSLAMGFRSTHGVVYILESGTNLLHQYFADGSLTTVPTPIDLPFDLEFKAGEISPDGNDFYVIGSSMDLVRSIFRINLLSGDYETTEIVLAGEYDIQDITFDPYDNFMYLYDRKGRKLLKLNLLNLSVTSFGEIEVFREIETLYFDAFGDLYGLGTTQSGVASGLFKIDKQDGTESDWAAGPVAFIEDATACPYTVKMRAEPSTLNAFPCEDLVYSYSIANATGDTQSGLIFRTSFSPGFKYQEVNHDAIGGFASFNDTTGILEIQDISIPPGIHSIQVRIELDQFVSAGLYTNRAEIIGLPATLGGNIISDYTMTPKEGDPTPVTITSIEDDSLFFTRFICAGESITLDGSEYGALYTWSNGSNDPAITIFEAGTYLLRARTGCTDVFVEYEVTVASCPFRLDMEHLPIPESTFPCTEIIYQFVIDNATGVTQQGIYFTDTFPPGFSFLDIISNPFGGELDESLTPAIVKIANLTIPTGIDTIRLLVEVGAVDPGPYANQARLDNLPLELGTFRLSDDPRTIEADSTDTTVLGVDSDSLFVDVLHCEGDGVILDASIYGTHFIWFNGEETSSVIVNEIGRFQVDVFNGCEESNIFFEVTAGEPIGVSFDQDVILLNLGDTIQLEPVIENEVDSLRILWSVVQSGIISCMNCQNPDVYPLQTSEFQVEASNGVCADSATVKILVDDTRRFYLPNVFTPNGDQVNDYLGIYSPDFGLINRFEVFDRSGNILFTSSNTVLNEPTTGWDGRFGERLAPTGVYFYNFEITFLDGFNRNYTGNVTLLR